MTENIIRVSRHAVRLEIFVQGFQIPGRIVGQAPAARAAKAQRVFKVRTEKQLRTAVRKANKSQGKDLLGPYPNRQDAEQALRSARERTERWDEEDREAEE